MDDVKFRYDAFISYSGGGNAGNSTAFDRRVAERLLRALESYRAPRSSEMGRRRLGKVFLDREEMQASDSLRESLRTALADSRFLIVICSPRAQRSRWVNEEISLFFSLHGREHVLSLLIEGEPEESFPEALLTAVGSAMDSHPSAIESPPLAADIRSVSQRQSLRLLRREKLRLLAPMLGCSFDGLRQREHQRFVRRAVGAGAALLSLSIGLASLSLALDVAGKRATKNYALALDANSRTIPLLILPPGDLSRRQMFLTNAVSAMEALCHDDPGSAACWKNLRALRGALSDVERSLGETNAAEQHFTTSKELATPLALARLHNWDPAAKPAADDLFSDLPDTSRLARLRDMLEIWERPDYPGRTTDAMGYVETASEYLGVLDTRTRQGRDEARRVLESASSKFRHVSDPEKLNEQHRALMTELDRALQRLSRMDRRSAP